MKQFASLFSRRTLAALGAGIIPLAAALALAQEQQQPPAVGPTLKVTTEVVNVYAVVEDKKGHLIPDLTKDDFEITEDNASQQIKYFSRLTDTPLTLGMLVDTSPSQRRVLSIEQQQADAFLQQVLRPKDMAFVIHFDLEVELLQDFTSDLGRLARAIDDTVINGGGRGPMPGTFPDDSPCCTQLYDAVYLASNDMMKNEIGRKVLILLTDGQDEGSKVTLAKALEASQKSDVMLYALNISDQAFYGRIGFGFQGGSVLKKLSDETGGRVIEIRNPRETAAAFDQIARELRTQYSLGYTSGNTKRDGSYRKIHVRVLNANYKVQARRGYYSPTD